MTSLGLVSALLIFLNIEPAISSKPIQEIFDLSIVTNDSLDLQQGHFHGLAMNFLLQNKSFVPDHPSTSCHKIVSEVQKIIVKAQIALLLSEIYPLGLALSLSRLRICPTYKPDTPHSISIQYLYVLPFIIFHEQGYVIAKQESSYDSKIDVARLLYEKFSTNPLLIPSSAYKNYNLNATTPPNTIFTSLNDLFMHHYRRSPVTPKQVLSHIHPLIQSVEYIGSLVEQYLQSPFVEINDESPPYSCPIAKDFLTFASSFNLHPTCVDTTQKDKKSREKPASPALYYSSVVLQRFRSMTTLPHKLSMRRWSNYSLNTHYFTYASFSEAMQVLYKTPSLKEIPGCYGLVQSFYTGELSLLLSLPPSSPIALLITSSHNSDFSIGLLSLAQIQIFNVLFKDFLVIGAEQNLSKLLLLLEVLEVFLCYFNKLHTFTSPSQTSASELRFAMNKSFYSTLRKTLTISASSRTVPQIVDHFHPSLLPPTRASFQNNKEEMQEEESLYMTVREFNLLDSTYSTWIRLQDRKLIFPRIDSPLVSPLFESSMLTESWHVHLLLFYLRFFEKGSLDSFNIAHYMCAWNYKMLYMEFLDGITDIHWNTELIDEFTHRYGTLPVFGHFWVNAESSFNYVCENWKRILPPLFDKWKRHSSLSMKTHGKIDFRERPIRVLGVAFDNDSLLKEETEIVLEGLAKIARVAEFMDWPVETERRSHTARSLDILINGASDAFHLALFKDFLNKDCLY